MNFNHVFCRSARPALCALTLAVMTLPGCQGRKVVARVNSETINEDDFTTRALHVTSLNPQAGMDAGGMTLVNMIKENLVLQLAKSKGVAVSDDQVTKYIGAMEKLHPEIAEGIRAGKLSKEDVNREYRMEMILFGLGTDNAKAETKDVQSAYDQHQAELSIKGSYTIRLLPLQDPAKAQLALDELKKSGDFKKAAIAAGLPPDVAATIGKDTVIPAAQAPPALKNALDTLKATDFAPAPIPLQNTKTGQQFFIVAQLVDKTKDRVLTLEETRPLVERFALSDKFPQWGQHADSAMNDFITQSKDNIQINIEGYKSLKDQFILPKPKAPLPAQAPPPNAPPPGGASGAAPGGSAPGGSAPPAGAGAAPPAGGKM